MKIIASLIIIIFLFLYINPSNYTSLDLLIQKINVVVEYKKQKQTLNIPIRTKLKDIIDLISIIDDDVDLDKIDKNKILIDNEQITLPIKTKKCININIANISQLTTLKGIGEKTAKLIIEFRENKHYFLVKEDLLLVKSIGKNKFEQIKDDICL